jgi:hypothetical protein
VPYYRVLKVTEIFTPSDYPLYTYVARDEERIEDRLREALMTPGEIVSVSGPSKSGKTVLVEQVAGRDNLITITGAGLSDASQVWDRTLDWMGAPTQTSQTTTSTVGASATATAKGGLTLPLLGSIGAEGGGGVSGSRASGGTEARTRTGLPQVVREIGNSSFVLLIDDFHYMPGAVQAEVAKQIKEAARQGVKIVTASVPRRSDDVVPSNPELRGRVRTVDTKPWKVSELVRIAELGFPAAGLRLPNATMRQLAVEASQSPQLMQAICLQICFTLKQYEAKAPIIDRQLSSAEFRTAYEETSTRTDFASLIRSMHAGPKIRGTERKEFELTDGSRGDVYRALLLALKADPPTLSFRWNEISRRVQVTCRPDSPQAASLSTACAQISKIAKEMYPNQRVVDWEGDPVNLLSIEDPYFLFYLRWSDKLAGLQREGAA